MFNQRLSPLLREEATGGKFENNDEDFDKETVKEPKVLKKGALRSLKEDWSGRMIDGRFEIKDRRLWLPVQRKLKVSINKMDLKG